jgi:hypothetical protein
VLNRATAIATLRSEPSRFSGMVVTMRYDLGRPQP